MVKKKKKLNKNVIIEKDNDIKSSPKKSDNLYIIMALCVFIILAVSFTQFIDKKDIKKENMSEKEILELFKEKTLQGSSIQEVIDSLKSKGIQEIKINNALSQFKSQEVDDPTKSLVTIDPNIKSDKSNCENLKKSVIFTNMQIPPIDLERNFLCDNNNILITFFKSPQDNYSEELEKILNELKEELSEYITIKPKCIPIKNEKINTCNKLFDPSFNEESLSLKMELGFKGTPTLLFNNRYLRSGTSALSKSKEVEKNELKKIICAFFKSQPDFCDDIQDDVIAEVTPHITEEPKPPVLSLLKISNVKDCSSDTVHMEFWVDFKDKNSYHGFNRLIPSILEFQEHITLSIAHYPLEQNIGSEIASEAFICAENLNKKKKILFGRCLFEKYLLENKDTQTLEVLKECVDEHNLDYTAFTQCLSNNEIKAQILEDKARGSKLGFSGLPSLSFNCQYVFSGAAPDQYIRSALCTFLKEKNIDAYKCNNVDLTLIEKKEEMNPYTLVDNYEPCHSPGTLKVDMYADFLCPYCNKTLNELMPVLDAFKDIIHLEIRQFPLPFHTNAKYIAKAHTCAKKYNEDLSFAKCLYRSHFIEGLNTTDDDVLKSCVTAVGLDIDLYEDCMESETTDLDVQFDIREANNYNIRGTPTFIIDCNKKLVGALPKETFIAAFCSVLEADARPKICNA